MLYDTPMKRLVFMLPLLLSACADPAQRAAYAQQVEQADHSECLRLGYQPGTPTYGDCRLRLREMRLEERAINRQPVFYPQVGAPYYGYRRHPW